MVVSFLHFLLSVVLRMIVVLAVFVFVPFLFTLVIKTFADTRESMADEIKDYFAMLFQLVRDHIKETLQLILILATVITIVQILCM